MIQLFIDAWMDRKEYFRDWIRLMGKEITYVDYAYIVQALFNNVINPYMKEVEETPFDVAKMTIINDGDYQGTLIYLIPKDTYQPYIDEYIYTHNYYGSCSGCDSLQHALSAYDYIKNELPDTAIDQLMSIGLHLIENFKSLG